MAEVINLRMARKRLKRNKKEQTAEQNRVKFGQTKFESQAIKARKELSDQNLDRHKLDGAD